MNRRIRYLMVAVLALALLGGATLATANPKKVKVKCDKGDSINDALTNPAEELIIEIRGMCRENVLVERDYVTLRGADPTVDGIQALSDEDYTLRVKGALGVRLENLRLTGGETGLSVNDTTYWQTHVENCRIEGNTFGAEISSANVRAQNSTFSFNDMGVWVGNAGWLICNTCTIADNVGSYSQGIYLVQAKANLNDTHISGSDYGLSAGSSSTVIVGSDSTISAAAYALLAGANSTLYVDDLALLSGSLQVSEGSFMKIGGTEQIANPEGNFVRNNSILLISVGFQDAGSSLTDRTFIMNFGKVAIGPSSTINGHLVCWGPSDAYCDDPENQVTGTSTCDQCLKP